MLLKIFLIFFFVSDVLEVNVDETSVGILFQVNISGAPDGLANLVIVINGDTLKSENIIVTSNFTAPGDSSTIRIVDGSWSGDVKVYVSSYPAYAYITYVHQTVPGPKAYDSLIIYPGAYENLVILSQWDSLIRGKNGGKISISTPVDTAGDTVFFRVYPVDRWFNPVLFDSVMSDTILLSTDCPYADYLSLGVFSSTYPPFVEGWGVFYRANDLSNPYDSTRYWGYSLKRSYIQDTSSFLMEPGPPEKVMFLLPGEFPNPGEISKGKLGTPQVQIQGVPFEVQLRVTDKYWNVTYTAFELIGHKFKLFIDADSSSYFSDVFEINSAGDTGAVIQMRIDVTGDKLVWLEDLTDPILSESLKQVKSIVKVEPKAGYLSLEIEKDKIVPYEKIKVTAKVYDVNNQALPGRSVIFKSNFGFFDPETVATNERGEAISYYQAPIPESNDTIDTLQAWTLGDNLVSDKKSVEIIYPQKIDLNKIPLVNYPNPFGSVSRPYTIFLYRIPDTLMVDRVVLEIYDIWGNKVVSKRFERGHNGALVGQMNIVTWDGKNDKGLKVATGVYVAYLKVYSGGKVAIKRKRMVGVVW